MPDYDLSRLSNRSFEQLVQSLAIRVLGPGVVVFGDGPDGGREATFEQQLSYPSAAEGWNGYGVVQAKYRTRSGNTKQDGNWAVKQLKGEIEKYTDPNSELRQPEYFVFATNVVLTPVHKKGSKDRVISLLEGLKKQSSLRDYAIWDYDQIRAYLDTFEDIRTSFAAFITPGDVLATLMSRLYPTPKELHDTFVLFLEKELLSDECVNLEQAGHDVEERIPLANVFVDLPTQSQLPHIDPHANRDSGIDDSEEVPSRDAERGFIREILTAASDRLDPASVGTSTISDGLSPEVTLESRGRFVLIGGPGQGKTTLTQFLCQIYRSAIISGKPSHSLSPEVRKALTTIQLHCKSEGINHKVVPRFPFKVILNDFAKALSLTSTSQMNSVLSYLAHQIKTRTDTEITVDDLRRFLGIYPSVLIFDGLDEVPASSNRDQVLEAIRDFWVEASNSNADILAIATSRPQGYNDDFSPSYYQHRKLAELSDQLGWHFAQRLTEIRYRTDEDRKQKVLNRLKRAFEDSSTARLMRSPLQVTIMTALVDRVGQPPQARWNLFNLYYNVIYQREVERSIPSSIILRDHEPDIRAIHNQVGLVLQIDSERTGTTDAKLSRDRFVSLVEARLTSEGHSGKELRSLAQQIVEAASQRLVFLVEVESEQIGFEIRSLQEFMAAESLMDGAEKYIKIRLEEITPIAFWRNVFLFAAGKCFAERQDLREAVYSICAGLNELNGNEVAGTFLAGSDLAVALLEEGSSRRQPKFENLLARIAIRALDIANPDLQEQLAGVYNSRLKNIYQEEIGLRLTGGDSIKSQGAWICLTQLAANGYSWAVQLADQSWPPDQDNRIRILEAITNLTKNSWATNKLLYLIPTTSLSTLSTMLRAEVGRDWMVGRALEPQQEAAISVIRAANGFTFPTVNVLGTSISYGPVVRLSGRDNGYIQRLREIQGWHPEWQVHRIAGEFLNAPSSMSLATSLRSIASICNEVGYLRPSFEWSSLPWPLLACLSSCGNASELLNLAERVGRGDLGDLQDWITAENRWFDNGVTKDDLLNMTDNRLPFDREIGISGFPTSISVFKTLIQTPESVDELESIVALFEQLPRSNTRSFVAKTINWLLFANSLLPHSNQASSLPRLNTQRLGAVYGDLPKGALVPLHVVANFAGESAKEIAKFLDVIRDKDFRFDAGNPNHNLATKVIESLRWAYVALNEDAALLPMLGVAAENGHLKCKKLEVNDPNLQQRVEQRKAAFLIRLSQEEWNADNCEQLLLSAQICGDMEAEDINRIASTLTRNRASGPHVGKFIVALKRLVASGESLANRRYVRLLEDVLRRRTSQFSVSSTASRFALSQGILRLLSAK